MGGAEAKERRRLRRLQEKQNKVEKQDTTTSIAADQNNAFNKENDSTSNDNTSRKTNKQSNNDNEGKQKISNNNMKNTSPFLNKNNNEKNHNNNNNGKKSSHHSNKKRKAQKQPQMEDPTPNHNGKRKKNKTPSKKPKHLNRKLKILESSLMSADDFDTSNTNHQEEYNHLQKVMKEFQEHKQRQQEQLRKQQQQHCRMQQPPKRQKPLKLPSFSQPKQQSENETDNDVCKKERTNNEIVADNGIVRIDDRISSMQKKEEKVSSPVTNYNGAVFKNIEENELHLPNPKREFKNNGEKDDVKNNEEEKHDNTENFINEKMTEKDSDRDDDDAENMEVSQKRERGRRRRGRKVSTVSTMAVEEKKENEKKREKTDGPRRCIGRKPVTDFNVGEWYTNGKVVYMKESFAFIDIGCHSDAMCHISEMSDSYISSIHDVFQEVGQIVPKVRVLNINRAKKQITVSLKKENKPQSTTPKKIENNNENNDKATFDDKNDKKEVSPSTTNKNDTVCRSVEKEETIVVDPENMTPAELKRARKLQRRQERRKQKEQTGISA